MILDGSNLTPEMLLKLGSGEHKIGVGTPTIGKSLCHSATKVISFQLCREAVDNVRKSRGLVEKILQEKKVVYGITTGIGNFAKVNIPKDKLEYV